jgi:hypothetical protein
MRWAAIAVKIVNQGSHCLLPLKQNKPTLCTEAERALDGARPQAEATGWASHNTPVRGQVAVQTHLRWVNEDERWPHLAALVRVDTCAARLLGRPRPRATTSAVSRP